MKPYFYHLVISGYRILWATKCASISLLLSVRPYKWYPGSALHTARASSDLISNKLNFETRRNASFQIYLCQNVVRPAGTGISIPLLSMSFPFPAVLCLVNTLKVKRRLSIVYLYLSPSVVYLQSRPSIPPHIPTRNRPQTIHPRQDGVQTSTLPPTNKL